MMKCLRKALKKVTKNAVARCEVSQYVLLCNEKGELLLLKPRGEEGWWFPGGRLNKHESWKQGLLREVLEETGIARIELDPRPLLVSNLASRRNVARYGVWFFAKALGASVNLSSEHTAQLWIDPGTNLSRLPLHRPIALELINLFFAYLAALQKERS